MPAKNIPENSDIPSFSEAVIRAFAADPSLSVLLSGREKSVDELKSEGYLSLEPDAILPEAVGCRLCLSEDEENGFASLDMICRHSAWCLEGCRIRPMELALRLIDALSGKAEMNGKKLRLLGTRQEALSDELSLFSVNYNVPLYELSIPEENPLRDYEHILSVVLARLAGQSGLRKALGAGAEATGADELVAAGRLRLSESLEDTAETFLMVTLDCSGGFILQITSVSRSADAPDRLAELREQIRNAMASIPGTKPLDSGDIGDLGDGRQFAVSAFSLQYDPQTFDTFLEEKDRPKTKPHFFCGLETLQALLNTPQEEPEEYIDLNLDVIELPYTFAFRSDADSSAFRAVSRGVLLSMEEEHWMEKGHLTVPRAGGQADGSTTEKVLADNMGAFFNACRKLSTWSQEHRLEPLYADMDPDKAGILLSLENGELTASAVRGKDRPDLVCEGLFGGTELARPYADEVMENSRMELLPLEARIEAAEAGDETAMDYLARLYHNGDDDTPADPEQAFYWAQKLAEAGNSIGMLNLGIYCAEGFGTERDFYKAAEWEEKAVEAGDEDGAGLAKAFRALAENLEKAQNGDAEAQGIMADGMMRLGTVLDQADKERDYAEAVAWAQKAAAQKDGLGLLTLAYAYQYGRGVEEDAEKAVRLFRRGAECGNARCMQDLACYYMNGNVVERDFEKGLDLFRRSAELGDPLAMQNLGQSYQYGIGVEEDIDKAIEWYEKSLEAEPNPELAQKVEFFKMMREEER